MKNIMFISNSSKERKLEIDKIKLDGVYVPCINALKKDDYNIYAGVNSDIVGIYEKENINYYNQNTYRKIFAFKDNRKAFKNINEIIKNNNINIIHCNTPIGGLMGRICGHKNHVEKVIYTAHGFHFFKGNSFLKNFIFRNVEKFLAHYTDAIITMNNEDYEAAKKFKLKKNGKVFFIHGIGINLDNFENIQVNKDEKLKELGLKNEDIVLISMGDLVKRKNYEKSLRIIAKCQNSKIKYLICGTGPELDNLKKLAKDLGIEKQVKFLGFRTDIKELLRISNIFLFTTLQEGLPRSLMEAMASGLPCVVSNIRGNVDLIDHGKGGYCCDTIEEYVKAINELINNDKIIEELKKYNLLKIKNYDITNVTKEMEKIYKELGL